MINWLDVVDFIMQWWIVIVLVIFLIVTMIGVSIVLGEKNKPKKTKKTKEKKD